MDKRWLRRTIAAAFWLAVWQGVSLALPRLLFASPVETALRLVSLLGEGGFWLSIAHSLGKIALGALLAAVLGALLAVAVYRSDLMRLLIEPAVQIMKSVPVACFVVVALIWVRSAWISVLTSFFVVFPVVYIQLRTGLYNVDEKMREMARAFRLRRRQRLQAVYLPSVMPQLLAACRIAVGMALKAGVAGEIIGLPRQSIGEQLYLSKLYLDTAGLFAWSIAIIVLSLALERLLVRLVGGLQQKWGDGA
ncbi:MAG: ABC transporter permease subunit [Eubacteriales bacterium]|nr:ABC transporter permease subunit [Eubacteriales bacterium]